jgi:hypothetical protein
LDIGGLFNFDFDSTFYSFTFTNNSFTNIIFLASSGKGSILYFIGTSISSFSFQNNIFNNISSSMNGVLHFNSTLETSKFIISNCNFTSCTSSYGGGIYIMGVYFILFIFILIISSF